MKSYPYVIVGGGMTAASAVQGIRESDPDGKIAMFSLESDPPYNRPPLTKGLWKNKPLSSIWRDTNVAGLDLYLKCRVQNLDTQKKQITDEHGELYQFEKLLLATGGTPKRLPFGGDQLIYLRTLADFKRLQAITKTGTRFGVIGGGFIGSEIAAALAMNEQEVVMIFPEEGIGARNFPGDLSLFLNDYYRQKGVNVLAKETIVGFKKDQNRPVLMTKGQSEIEVDGVVAGIGIQPNTDLAEAAGVKVNHGIVVDKHLHTSQPDIFAAGDGAEFFNPALDKYIRVEHEDNANKMGRLAGQNMAGGNASYDYLPYFYSDLFDLGYEAVGELDSHLEIVSDWQEKYHQGVVYYMKDGRVRGVLLWNVWGKVDAARELIARPGPFQPADLKGAIGSD